jgi:FkbM family methyltransferase
LGSIATHHVRRITGEDFEIVYLKKLWTHRSGHHFVPDSPKFDYGYDDFHRWKDQIEQYISETNEYWLRHYQPKEGDVIVDVGAGRAEDTLTFSRGVGKTGRVIAIEAHPFSFAILNNFCRLNRLDNVTALHIALMDKPGTAYIVESQSWAENSIALNRDSGGMPVRAATFDDICEEQGLKKIAFLKMNIEGAERYSIQGMTKCIPNISHICVACHDFRYENGDGDQFCTRALVEHFLIGHGFTPTSRPNDPRPYVRDHVFGIRYEN